MVGERVSARARALFIVSVAHLQSGGNNNAALECLANTLADEFSGGCTIHVWPGAGINAQDAPGHITPRTQALLRRLAPYAPGGVQEYFLHAI